MLVPIRGVRPNSPVTIDQGLVEQAPGCQVVDQRGDSPIGGRQQPVLERLEVGRMRVPRLDASHVDLNDGHADLRPGAWPSAAIGRTCGGRSGRGAVGLRGQVEGPRDLAREQAACRPARPVRRTGPSTGRLGAADLVVHRRSAASSSDFRRSSRSTLKPAGSVRPSKPNPGRFGSWRDLPGVVLRAQETRVLARPGRAGLPSRTSAASRRWERRRHRGPDRVDRRGVAGIVVARGDLVEERTRLRMARQDLMGRVQVVGIGVRERPDDRPA